MYLRVSLLQGSALYRVAFQRVRAMHYMGKEGIPVLTLSRPITGGGGTLHDNHVGDQTIKQTNTRNLNRATAVFDRSPQSARSIWGGGTPISIQTTSHENPSTFSRHTTQLCPMACVQYCVMRKPSTVQINTGEHSGGKCTGARVWAT